MTVKSTPIIVGHVLHSFNEGGMERGVLNLINFGNQDKFYHVIICLTEAGALGNEINSKACCVVELKKKKGNDLKVPVGISRAIKEFNIDIVHARGWPTMVETVVGALGHGVKGLLYGFHGKTIEDIQCGLSLKRRLTQKVFVRFYDEVITLNQIMKEDFVKECCLPKHRVQVVFNGVDVDRFHPMAEMGRLRERYRIPRGKFVIGSVGRLDPVKNHEVILRALSIVKKKEGQCLFLLVGEGDNLIFLEKEIERLGIRNDVLLFGRSSQIPELLNCMDLYIQSSWYEGFSNTLLEAMSCGVPVLASAAGGNADVLASGGEGILFDPRNQQQLADLIWMSMNDNNFRESQGNVGRAHVVKEYSIQNMVRTYEKEYSRLAGSQRVGL